MVLLKESPWKGVIRFRKQSKLGPRYTTHFRLVAWVGMVAYCLDLPEELIQIHSTFHISQLWKCLVDDFTMVPLEDIQVDDLLHHIEKPVAILDRKMKTLRNKVVNFMCGGNT